MAYYPILLNLRGKTALVVGGGKVASRKIETLLEYDCRVHLAARDLTAELKRYVVEGRIRHLGPEFLEAHLEGVFLVIAATDDPGLNRKVSQKAQKRGLLINAVDQPDDCNFIVPSVLRRGDLLVSVSTSGSSPAMAKKIREDLENTFGNEYEAFLALMGKLRKEVLSRGFSGEKNKRIFYDFVHSPIPQAIRNGEWDRVAAMVNGIVGSRYEPDELLELSRPERSDGGLRA